MGRTNDLRKLIRGKLLHICRNVYYETAPDTFLYPHITFSCKNMSAVDGNRQDIMLDIDLWDKSENANQIEEMADETEDAFNIKNEPQDTILPTFYLVSRNSVEDENKMIRHRAIRVLIETYERKE